MAKDARTHGKVHKWWERVAAANCLHETALLKDISIEKADASSCEHLVTWINACSLHLRLQNLQIYSITHWQPLMAMLIWLVRFEIFSGVLMVFWQGFWAGDSHAVNALLFFRLGSLRGLWHAQIQCCLIFRSPFHVCFSHLTVWCDLCIPAHAVADTVWVSPRLILNLKDSA